MIALHIADIKEFTSKLFLHEDFDSFLVSQASFTTGFSVTLDGSLHKDYFTDEQWEAMEQHDLARWSLMRPLCFQIIKGSRLPEQFKIILALSRANTVRLINGGGLSVSPEQVGGLYLNIRYENSRLFCITGVSFASFSMDKTLEHTWDDMVKKILTAKKIAWEEQ